MAKDPVCGMEVKEGKAATKSRYKGETYYFCAPGCKQAFSRSPEKYLKEKGWWGKFLGRMASTSQEQFKGQAPSCHKK